ncbi:MAG TPA: M14 family metallopeptidase, partial [Gemmataceae bacterium]|nr:M14 family metallopeptidase [Gemmataceae bacterium]
MSTVLNQLVLLFAVFAGPGQQPAAEPLLTVAEKSDFKATSRHADVVAFCERLAKEAPLVRLGELGTSHEGRKLPLIILADPPISTPEEAEKSGKVVVFAMGNIHAGEVDGKEAILMLAREIATAKDKPLLKDLVIVFAPIFNADGNERIDKKHRTDQNGPTEGVGIRENAQGFDLNRDFVKLESPEVRALVQFLNKWKPALMVDMHTTNGSYHRYTLTYDGPRHPAADAPLIELVRDRLLPDVGKKLEAGAGYKSFFYGDFSPDHKKWLTYGAQPRFGLQYVALRHRISILSESYTYAPFKDRVLVGKAFVQGLFEYVAEHKDEIRKLEADPKTPDKIPLRMKTVARSKPYTALGFIEEMKDGRHVPTDQAKDYEVELIDRVEPTLFVTRPYAYLFPASYAKVVENLQRHGIQVEELREDIELDVEVYRVDKIEKAKQPFQKHTLETVDVTARPEARRFSAGTILVKTAQPLGTLASFILEPQADDGLTTWNFFDAGLEEKKDFPVVRLLASTPITSGAVKPLSEERKTKKTITEDMVYGKEPMPNLHGNPVGGLTWLEDGEHFLQIKENQLRKVNARTGRS